MELRRERAGLVNQARGILDAAEAAKRSLDGQEEERYRKLDADIDALTERIDREERLAEREDVLNTRLADPIVSQPAQADKATREAARSAEVRKFLRGEAGAPGALTFRALQMDDDVSGGYTVEPEQFVARLIQAVDNETFMRQLGTGLPLVATAESVGAPSLDADPADADWTTELGTGSADSTMAFGKRELTPHPMAKRLKVSKKLLRASSIDVEALVRNRLAYKFGVTFEKGALTGTGSQQALGVFTASNDGIPTTRDVSTGNTSTSIQTDGLVEAMYSLKPGYMARSTWIFHRDAVKQVRKLKDGDGQYIWQQGLTGGQPDRILDRPFKMSEYAPSTFTSGLYVGIIGDFSYYWYVDALGFTLQRLMELYAETNQDGFIGRMETDGMPVLAEAFARVKLD